MDRRHRTFFDDPPPRPSPSIPKCPGCGASDVRKASVVWEGGTVHTVTRGTAVGVVGDEIAIGGVGSRSVHQTGLAQRAAPPAKPHLDNVIGLIILAIGVVVAPIAGSLLIGAVLLALFVGLAAWSGRRYYGEQLPDWKAAVAAWEHRCWVCFVCGKIFMAQ